jgi:hypothetical protein
MTSGVEIRPTGADSSPLYAIGGAGACALVLVAAVVLSPEPVTALPSYARQTGQPCATCHNGAFPQLTPYGRQFKLNGYTAGGTRCHDSVSASSTEPFQIPLSVMAVPTFTHTQKELADLPTNRKGELNGLKTNDNLMMQDMSVFYGGQIYCQLGAFIQATYDRNDQAFFLDNTDIRYADKRKVAGIDVLYGATVNNNPTVEDPWNTTPAWRIPGGGSITSAFAPGPPTPLIENLGGLVGGGGGYVFVNNMFYAAVSDYKTLDKRTLQTLGEGPPSIGFVGPAPYWRLAIEKNWGNYSLMFGTFGMHANLIPDVTMVSPTDKITDVGWDAQLQYLSDKHFFTGRVSYTNEWERLDGSVFNGTAANLNNHLSAFNLSGTYSFDATYTLTLGYFYTRGSTDLNPATGASYFGTFNGSPNTKGEVLDVGYSPWSRGGPPGYPWINMRLGVQYWHYDKLNGATTNYDGAGRNAKDDNTTLLYAWTAF